MELVIGKKYQFYAYVEQINQSSYDTVSMNVKTSANQSYVLRIAKDALIKQYQIYYFETEAILFKDKVHLLVLNFKAINEMTLDAIKKDAIIKNFYQYAPIDIKVIKTEIEAKLNLIENQVIKDITKTIFDKYKENFYLFPAAIKLHHAYVSGLAYHTYTMLRLSTVFLEVYPFLSADLIFSGIILHDLAKTIEISGFEGEEYSLEGKLLGHITLGINLIHETAVKLDYLDKEETLLLKHILLSHHYFAHFGSPKRPNIAEALIVHFLDNIDSKVCVLGEELALINQGDFTQSINVLDREKYYKHILSK